MTAARARCGSERLQGTIEARGDSLRIHVYAGPDPVAGRPVYLRETVRGTDDADRCAARRTLNRLVAEAEKARRPSSVVSLGHVIDEWMAVAEHERQHPRDLPGRHRAHDQADPRSMSIAKLSVPHLKTLYAELRVLAIRSRLVRSVLGAIAAGHASLGSHMRVQ